MDMELDEGFSHHGASRGFRKIRATPSEGIRRRSRGSRGAEHAFGRSRAARRGQLWILRIRWGVFAVCVCVILGFSLRAMIPQRVTTNTALIPTRSAALPVERQSPMAWEDMAPDEAARAFLQANHHEDRLRFLAYPEVEGPLMKTFFEEGPGATEIVVNTARAFTSPESGMERFLVTMKDGRTRWLVVPIDGNRGRIDFKSYARHCAVPWSKLLDGSVARSSEMRVLLRPCHYYNGAYSDESQWLSFTAESPDLTDTIYLYLDKTTAVAHGWSTQGARHCTVAIEATGNSWKLKQFRIMDAPVSGWLGP